MTYNNIYYTILSLMTPERQSLVQQNVNLFPFITVTKSINGYDINETLQALKETKLKYHHLEFPTYGTLANFITKYNILKYQIGYCESGQYSNKIIIPNYTAEGKLNYFIARSFEQDPARKYDAPSADKNSIIGFENLNSYIFAIVII